MCIDERMYNFISSSLTTRGEKDVKDIPQEGIRG